MLAEVRICGCRAVPSSASLLTTATEAKQQKARKSSARKRRVKCVLNFGHFFTVETSGEASKLTSSKDRGSLGLARTIKKESKQQHPPPKQKEIAQFENAWETSQCDATWNQAFLVSLGPEPPSPRKTMLKFTVWEEADDEGATGSWSCLGIVKVSLDAVVNKATATVALHPRGGRKDGVWQFFSNICDTLAPPPPSFESTLDGSKPLLNSSSGGSGGALDFLNDEEALVAALGPSFGTLSFSIQGVHQAAVEQSLVPRTSLLTTNQQEDGRNNLLGTGYEMVNESLDEEELRRRAAEKQKKLDMGLVDSARPSRRRPATESAAARHRGQSSGTTTTATTTTTSSTTREYDEDRERINDYDEGSPTPIATHHRNNSLSLFGHLDPFAEGSWATTMMVVSTMVGMEMSLKVIDAISWRSRLKTGLGLSVCLFVVVCGIVDVALATAFVVAAVKAIKTSRQLWVIFSASSTPTPTSPSTPSSSSSGAGQLRRLYAPHCRIINTAIRASLWVRQKQLHEAQCELGALALMLRQRTRLAQSLIILAWVAYTIILGSDLFCMALIGVVYFIFPAYLRHHNPFTVSNLFFWWLPSSPFKRRQNKKGKINHNSRPFVVKDIVKIRVQQQQQDLLPPRDLLSHKQRRRSTNTTVENYTFPAMDNHHQGHNSHADLIEPNEMMRLERTSTEEFIVSPTNFSSGGGNGHSYAPENGDVSTGHQQLPLSASALKQHQQRSAGDYSMDFSPPESKPSPMNNSGGAGVLRRRRHRHNHNNNGTEENEKTEEQNGNTRELGGDGKLKKMATFSSYHGEGEGGFGCDDNAGADALGRRAQTEEMYLNTAGSFTRKTDHTKQQLGEEDIFNSSSTSSQRRQQQELHRYASAGSLRPQQHQQQQPQPRSTRAKSLHPGNLGQLSLDSTLNHQRGRSTPPPAAHTTSPATTVSSNGNIRHRGSGQPVVSPTQFSAAGGGSGTTPTVPTLPLQGGLFASPSPHNPATNATTTTPSSTNSVTQQGLTKKHSSKRGKPNFPVPPPTRSSNCPLPIPVAFVAFECPSTQRKAELVNALRDLYEVFDNAAATGLEQAQKAAVASGVAASSPKHTGSSSNINKASTSSGIDPTLQNEQQATTLAKHAIASAAVEFLLNLRREGGVGMSLLLSCTSSRGVATPSVQQDWLPRFSAQQLSESCFASCVEAVRKYEEKRGPRQAKDTALLLPPPPPPRQQEKQRCSSTYIRLDAIAHPRWSQESGEGDDIITKALLLHSQHQEEQQQRQGLLCDEEGYAYFCGQLTGEIGIRKAYVALCAFLLQGRKLGVYSAPGRRVVLALPLSAIYSLQWQLGSACPPPLRSALTEMWSHTSGELAAGSEEEQPSLTSPTAPNPSGPGDTFNSARSCFSSDDEHPQLDGVADLLEVGGEEILKRLALHQPSMSIKLLVSILGNYKNYWKQQHQHQLHQQQQQSPSLLTASQQNATLPPVPIHHRSQSNNVSAAGGVGGGSGGGGVPLTQGSTSSTHSGSGSGFFTSIPNFFRKGFGGSANSDKNAQQGGGSTSTGVEVNNPSNVGGGDSQSTVAADRSGSTEARTVTAAATAGGGANNASLQSASSSQQAGWDV